MVPNAYWNGAERILAFCFQDAAMNCVLWRIRRWRGRLRSALALRSALRRSTATATFARASSGEDILRHSFVGRSPPIDCQVMAYSLG
jgi:hypothetical protein